MGHNPIPILPPPTGEAFHLGRAREAFVTGRIELGEFEEMVAHVLGGGYLGERLELRTRELDQRAAAAVCAKNGHEWVEITGYGSLGQEFMCARCGEDDGLIPIATSPLL